MLNVAHRYDGLYILSKKLIFIREVSVPWAKTEYTDEVNGVTVKWTRPPSSARPGEKEPRVWSTDEVETLRNRIIDLDLFGPTFKLPKNDLQSSEPDGINKPVAIDRNGTDAGRDDNDQRNSVEEQRSKSEQNIATVTETGSSLLHELYMEEPSIVAEAGVYTEPEFESAVDAIARYLSQRKQSK